MNLMQTTNCPSTEVNLLFLHVVWYLGKNQSMVSKFETEYQAETDKSIR